MSAIGASSAITASISATSTSSPTFVLGRQHSRRNLTAVEGQINMPATDRDDWLDTVARVRSLRELLARSGATDLEFDEFGESVVLGQNRDVESHGGRCDP